MNMHVVDIEFLSLKGMQSKVNTHSVQIDMKQFAVQILVHEMNAIVYSYFRGVNFCTFGESSIFM